MSEYNNTFRRLDKIAATMKALHETNVALRAKLQKRDESLVAKVRSQAATIQTLIQQAAARERVLQSYVKKHEPEVSSP